MIIDKLKEFIALELLQSDAKLDDDTLLIQSGTLTSLQTIGLVQFIQTEFGVEIELFHLLQNAAERSPRNLSTTLRITEREFTVQRLLSFVGK